MLEELLVVIVLFKQTPEQSAAYNSLHAALRIFHSFPKIVVYDNSPESAVVESHVIYFHDPGNGGVSKAYNRASRVAQIQKKKWILLLDQDTQVEALLFEKWTQAVSTHPLSVAFVPVIEDRKGVVSPFYFVAARGRRINVIKRTFPLDKYRFINSGLFIGCNAFVLAGGYDEEIPLDFSDISFGERLRKITDHFVVLETSLAHEFSATTGLQLIPALERFHYFCRGALIMGKRTGRRRLFFIQALLRTIRLSAYYRSTSFFRIFYQYFAHG